MTSSENSQTTENAETTEKIETSEDEKSEKKALPWWKGKRAKYGLIVGVCALVIACGAGIAITTGNVNPVDTLTGVNRNADSKNQSQINDTNSESEAPQADKKAEEAKEEAANNASASMPSNASSGSTSTPASGNSSSSSAHTHSWTPVYKTVHHDAVTHEEPVYETRYEAAYKCANHHIELVNNRCSQCKTAVNQYGGVPSNTYLDYYAKQVTKQTGTKVVTDKASYDEQVVDHYSCSCGATK